MVVHTLRQSLLKMSHSVALKTDRTWGENMSIFTCLNTWPVTTYSCLFGKFGADWAWLY